MIPCGTRSRPILHIASKEKGISVFTNNIHSPGPFHASTFILQQEAFHANAVSCMINRLEKVLKNYHSCGLDIASATVAFWSTASELKPLLSIEVYIPINWSPHNFLLKIEDSISECSVISLLLSF